MIVVSARQMSRESARPAFEFCSKVLVRRVIPTACKAVALAVFAAMALPAEAGTAVGALSGQFAVSATGAATYSLPINLPPGVRNLKPNLALAYSSQGGAGLAGFGWNLQGISAITRCPKNTADDGQIQAVSMSTTDDFCLDGQKLRPDGNGNYRTQMDQFAEIIPQFSGGSGPVPSSGPQWFEVLGKDGLTYVYGKTASSEILADGPQFQSAACGAVTTPVVRVWALNRINDNNRNGMNFSYATDPCTGDYWITSITYTDVAGVGGTQTVSFTYDNLLAMWPLPADADVAYAGGAAAGHTKRLNGITVTYTNPTTGASSTTLSYSFSYQLDTATRYSQLTGVTECAGGNCLPATSIGWQSGSKGWSGAVTAASATYSATFALAMDVDGNSTQDLVFADTNNHVCVALSAVTQHLYSPTCTSATYPNISGATPMNYLGNGQQSLLVPVTVGSSTVWHVLTYSNGGFVDTSLGVSATGWQQGVFTGDINGDGLDDIIFTTTAATTTPIAYQGDEVIEVYYNSTSGINSNTPATVIFDAQPMGNFTGSPFGTGSNQFRNSARVGDFDGDGRADILVNITGNLGCNTTGSKAIRTLNSSSTNTLKSNFTNPCSGNVNKWTVLRSTGTTLVHYGTITDSDPNYQPLLLDINGDGLMDMAYVCASGMSCTAGDWVIAVSTGAGFTAADTGKTAVNPNNALAVDYEGDGHQDILYPTSGDWYVYSSEYYPANGSVAPYYGLSSPQDTGLSAASLPSTLESADLNGDGQVDLVGPGASGNWIYAIHAGAGVKSDVVTSIQDGLGNYRQVNYSAINDPWNFVYVWHAANSNYLTWPYMGPMYVVGSYTTNSGANNTAIGPADPSSYSVTYTYGGAAVDVQGRGFLGFASVQAVDNILGTTTVSTYDQAYPYIGSLLEQTVTTSGTLQVDIKNTYANIVTSGSVAAYTDANFPYTATSTAYSYGSGGHDAMSGQLTKTAKTTSTFDNFGNPTLITNDINPGAAGHFEQNLIYTYNENTATWCVGLPESVTVAKSYGYANTTPGTDNGRYGNQARETTYSNDYSNCRVNSKTVVALEPGLSLTTTNSYTDSWGNVNEIKVTDGNGSLLRDTLYDYSGTNGAFPTTTTENDATNGVNLKTAQTWDLAHGVTLTSTDINNNLTTGWSYDNFGRRLTETEPDGTSTQIVYTLCPGSSPCVTPGTAYYVDTTHYASDNTPSDSSRVKYDSFNRAIETVSYVLGDQKVYQDTQYNELGLKVAVSAPYMSGATVYWTTTAYDNQNRPKTITQPASQNSPSGTTTSIEYNSNYSGTATPFAVTRTVTTNASDAPSSQTATKVLDSQGNVAEMDDAQNHTLYSTDAFGDVISVTDTAGHVTNIDYDSVGHKIDMLDPDTGKWTYQVDALGEVISETDANGNLITQQYDNLGRLTSRTETPAGGSAVATNWTYDTAANGAGKLATENKGNFTKIYSYDTDGRAISTDTNIAGTDYVSSMSYDKFGRLASVNYPATPVAPADVAPVANAGNGQTVTVNNSVTLDGSASNDPDNGPLPLTYTWSEIAGPVNVGIDGSRTSKVSFTPTTGGVYGFQLEVGDGELTSTASVTITVNPGTPNAPTVPQNNYTGTVNLTWSSLAGVTYNVFQSPNGVNATQIATGVAGGSYPVPGLGNGNYYFAIQAVQNGATSSMSPWSTAVTVLLPPAAPTGLNVNPSGFTAGTSFSVAWTASATATSYEVFAAENTGAYTQLGTVTGSPYQVTNAGGYTYTLYVEACNTGGCSAPSATVVENVLVPPFSLTLQTNPSWNGNFALYSMGGSYGATSYEVFQSTNGGPYSLIQTILPGPGTPPVDTSVTGLANGNYSFYIESCGGGICSAPGPVASGTVMISPSVNFSPSTSNSGAFSLSWSGVSNATYYQVSQSTSGASGPWTTTNVSGTSYSPSNLVNGTYWFRVTPCNASVCGYLYGGSAVSGTVNITPPTGLSLSPNPSTTGNFTLSWSSSWNGPYPIEQYRIYQSVNGANYTWAYTINNSTSQQITNLPNANYTYFIEACNQAACSSGSNTVTETVSLITPPPAPTLYAPTTAALGYTVSWTSPSTATYFELYESKNSPSAYVQVYNGSATSYQASIGARSTGQYWYVVACNQAGCGPSSGVSEVTYNSGGLTGCPPPPYQCQFAPTSDYVTMRGDAHSGNSVAENHQLVAGINPAAVKHRIVRTGPQLVALRRQLLQRAPSLVSPSAQAEWQKHWLATAEIAAAAQAKVTEPSSVREALEQASDAAVYRTTDPTETSLQARLNDQDGPQDPSDYRVQLASGGTGSFTVNYVYDDHDNLEAVVDAQDPTLVYWQAESSDNWGNTTGELYGNNVLTTQVYDAATGTLLGISSGVGASTAVQNLQYQWDGFGNLSQRQNLNAGLTETFQYDSLNRLTAATVSGSTLQVPALSLGYDALGNIQSKSDAGTYAYDPNHAHRLQSVTPAVGSAVSYQFDNNGNLLSSSDGRSVNWTVDNKPGQITSGANSTTFSYDPENQRYSEYALTNGANGVTTLEIGALMEIITPDSGSPSYRLMIKANGRTVAVRTVQSSGAFSVNYLHYDHLGSVETITNVSGNVSQHLSYDSFGRRRDPSTWALLPGGGNYTAITDRGYTNQQQLDGLGLIHMNGRVYDPALGRFMSADPNIQSLYYSQSLNRYAYVDNNPLRFTDPSGYCSVGSDLLGLGSGGLFGGGCGRDAFKTLLVDAWHFINHPAKDLEYTAPGIGNFINVRMSHSHNLQVIDRDIAAVVSIVVSCIPAIGPAFGALIWAANQTYLADINYDNGMLNFITFGMSYETAYGYDTQASSAWNSDDGQQAWQKVKDFFTGSKSAASDVGSSVGGGGSSGPSIWIKVRDWVEKRGESYARGKLHLQSNDLFVDLRDYIEGRLTSALENDAANDLASRTGVMAQFWTAQMGFDWESLAVNLGPTAP